MTPRPLPSSGFRRVFGGLVVTFLLGATILGAALCGATSAATLVPPGELAADGREADPTADGPIDADDGVLPDGVSVFDDGHPGIASLSPALLQALRDATSHAADDGIRVHVNSGWRSARYQDQLFRDAVAEYGSPHEAARWVATAATSAHVAGEAVDIGAMDAVAWMSRHGAAYGLCQTYANEAWHFELRPEAVGRGCPPPYADPTEDPRMQG